MAVVINGTYATEVQPTTIAAAQLPGLVLQYNASGILAPATTRVDALLMSEVVSQADYINRYFIYQDVDFGPYTQIGEASTVAKGFRGYTAIGILVNAPTLIAAGTELQLNSGVLGAYVAGTKFGAAVDAIAAGSQYTGQVHIY